MNNTILEIIRWIALLPAAFYGSEIFGTGFAFLCWGIRHIGGKIIGDKIDLLKRPLAILGFFITGLLFVAIGGWIAPSHKTIVVIVLVGIKAIIDWQRARTHYITHGAADYNSAAATIGAIVAAFNF